MITEITLQLADLCKIIICSFLLLWLLFSPSSTGYSSICFLYGDNILVKDHNVPVHLPCDLSPPYFHNQGRQLPKKKNKKFLFQNGNLCLFLIIAQAFKDVASETLFVNSKQNKCVFRLWGRKLKQYTNDMVMSTSEIVTRNEEMKGCVYATCSTIFP